MPGTSGRTGKMVENLTPGIKLDETFYDVRHHPAGSTFCRRHSHDCVEIVFIVGGSGEHSINGTRMFAYPGSVFFVMPGDVHEFSACGTLEQFTVSCAPELLLFFGVDVSRLRVLNHLSMQKQSSGCRLNSRDLYDARKILAEMSGEFSRAGALSDKLKFHSLFTLLLAIVAQAMERVSDAPEKNDPVCEIQIERFIREHFQQNLPLKKLAALCHYSVSQLVRRFRRRYGVTPIARQLEIRLDHAAQLLQSTELTVSEIAYRCGFSTCTYFSRRFRLRYGVSPTRFRLRE